MEGRISSTSMARLNELQTLVFNDAYALQIYRKYLSSSSTPTLVNHVDFYEHVLAADYIYHQDNNNSSDNYAKMCDEIYAKYFVDPQHSLVISPDAVAGVAENMKLREFGEDNGSVFMLFKPALSEVVRDLSFENFSSFANSRMFATLKEYLQMGSKAVEEELMSLCPRARRTLLRLRKFFGETIGVNDEGRVTRRAQPSHVKNFKLSRRFGERVLVEHDHECEQEETIALMHEEDTDDELMTSPASSTNDREHRRSRRLHVFFGDLFSVDDVIFSEKIRAPLFHGDNDEGECCVMKQPDHVNPHRLNRFFGERLHSANTIIRADYSSDEYTSESGSDNDSADEQQMDAMSPGSRFARNQRIRRFFGERMDPSKEALSKSFVDQPLHVKPMKLRKIFGTPAAGSSATVDDAAVRTNIEDDSGPTRETRRTHRLHRFFGSRIEVEEPTIPVPQVHVNEALYIAA